MEELKFPEGPIPQDKPRGLPMDEYLEFVLFNRKNFPCVDECTAPAPVRFVIQEDDASFRSVSRKP